MQPRPIRSYASELYEYVPKQAFQSATYKLIPMYIHGALIFLWWYTASSFDSIAATCLFALLAGVSVACVFLYSHELSHKTILRKGKLLYIHELFFWTFSGIPPTVWNKVHNYTHHMHMNTYKDPDRKTFKSEESTLSSRLYNLFIYPNRVLRYSFTVGFAMLFYSTKHILAAVLPETYTPSIVTYVPDYTRREKARVWLELLYMAVFYGAICYWLGMGRFSVFALVSWSTYSFLVMTIIVTQHLGNPMYKDVADPMLTSTSVILPQWLDRVFDWHSFHVEHHIFPGINFDYYKELSPILKQKYGSRYQRLPLLAAMKESYSNDVFVDDPIY